MPLGMHIPNPAMNFELKYEKSLKLKTPAGSAPRKTYRLINFVLQQLKIVLNENATNYGTNHHIDTHKKSLSKSIKFHQSESK